MQPFAKFVHKKKLSNLSSVCRLKKAIVFGFLLNRDIVFWITEEESGWGSIGMGQENSGKSLESNSTIIINLFR